MKATINGITVEGTPEEIWSMIQLTKAEGTNVKPYPTLEEQQQLWQKYIDAQKKQQWVDCGTTNVHMKWPNMISMNI